ncbi:MAG: DUF86 domain-containing protein [Candidatus Kerfeldbacteria bacterium]|nr:DUF86 domain-containing protein [Candidatus Kerfeldbacteria bacterium]
MTIDHESIIEKKAKLQQAIRVLKRLREYPLNKLTSDEITVGSALHYLTIAIEAVLDIGAHILTEDFKASPETYEDVITLLKQHNVIPASLAQRSSGMGKFRNKMIHEYADINIAKVYAYLKTAPDEFEQFDQAFSVYLKRSE